MANAHLRKKAPASAELSKLPAVIRRSEIQKLEDGAAQIDWMRRAMWPILAMPGKEIALVARTDRTRAVGWASLLYVSKIYGAKLWGTLQLLAITRARLSAALEQRQDVAAVRKEGTKAVVDSPLPRRDLIKQRLRAAKIDLSLNDLSQAIEPASSKSLRAAGQRARAA